MSDLLGKKGSIDRRPDADELYKIIGAFLYGLGIKMAVNE
jgi:hypothetical protein